MLKNITLVFNGKGNGVKFMVEFKGATNAKEFKGQTYIYTWEKLIAQLEEYGVDDFYLKKSLEFDYSATSTVTDTEV